jgi:hypothetical protein
MMQSNGKRTKEKGYGLLRESRDLHENNLLTSNLNQVCVCVQTNILNAKFK